MAENSWHSALTHNPTPVQSSSQATYSSSQPTTSQTTTSPMSQSNNPPVKTSPKLYSSSEWYGNTNSTQNLTSTPVAKKVHFNTHIRVQGTDGEELERIKCQLKGDKERLECRMARPKLGARGEPFNVEEK